MTKKKKDPTVEYSDQVKEQMAKDPQLADFLREFAANARQAMEGIDSGKYEDFGEAMEAITGRPASAVEPEEMPVEAQDELYRQMSEEGAIVATKETRDLYDAIAYAIGNDHHLYVVGCALAAIVSGWIDMAGQDGADSRAEFFKLVAEFDKRLREKRLS